MTKKAPASARTGGKLRRETPCPHLAALPGERYIRTLKGGEAHGRYRMHGKHRRRDRRSANAAPAGGADAVCRDDAALCGLGWIVAGLRHPVSGARSEFCGLSGGDEARAPSSITPRTA